MSPLHRGMAVGLTAAVCLFWLPLSVWLVTR